MNPSVSSLGTRSKHTRPQQPFISQVQAQYRSSIISKVSYDLALRLSVDEPLFDGRVRLSFDLSAIPDELTIDFVDGELLVSHVNGKLENLDYQGNFIVVLGNSLKIGNNQIELTYRHRYSQASSGLYRSRDPQDGHVYVYTDFEPYMANQLFPCFDQPDLKATYVVQVDAPQQWTVISAMRESSVESLTNGMKRWLFPETARFSTYLFPLHAGPFHMWSDESGTIPLRLFSRQSIAHYVKPEFWFAITQQGFAFYQDYFSSLYPFGKYDQIIVPEFNSGAMENVGAVTFSERYIRRGDETRLNRFSIAEVILHEMAHMWFGNLVTMRWWNDLWLNESFATYMSYVALHRSTEFVEAWHQFHDHIKTWAYREDQLVTTHPIEVDVVTTAEAFANFDGITYGKGASSLQQLAYYIGDDAFRKGVQAYFKDFAYANTTLPDFIESLAAQTSERLSTWVQAWLQKPGLNTLRTDMVCQDGVITTFDLIQTAPPENNHLRPHRARVGLFYRTNETMLKLGQAVSAVYEGDKSPLLDAHGQVCPDFIWPNMDDFDFVKVHLSDSAIKVLSQYLHTFEDAHLRSMLWLNLWHMLVDQTLPLPNLVALIEQQLPLERNLSVLRIITGRILSPAGRDQAVLALWPHDNVVERAGHEQLIQRFEFLFWQLLEQATPGSDEQKHWFDSYVSAANSSHALSRLEQVMDGAREVVGVSLDQDRRWAILRRLSLYDRPGIIERLDQERQRDLSSAGMREWLIAQVLLPRTTTKKEWFAKIIALDGNYILADQKSMMSGFFPWQQMSLRTSFADQYYAALPKLAKTHSDEFFKFFASVMVPVSCNPDSVNRLGHFINEAKDLSPITMKSLRVIHQDSQRCLGIQALARKHILMP